MNDEAELSADQRRLIRGAPLIVLGTVERPRPADGVGVVAIRVDDTLRAPAAFRGLAGQQLEVRAARKAGSAGRGERLVLLAEGVGYGETMIVRELARLPAEAAARVREAVDRVEREAPLERLRGRVEEATAVVVAAVEELHRHEPEGRQARPSSEHDPDLWIAELSVRDVLFGEPRMRNRALEVAFPNSRDVIWASVPKPQPGQEAIWLLRNERVGGAPSGFYTALDADDVRPLEDWKLVSELVRARR